MPCVFLIDDNKTSLSSLAQAMTQAYIPTKIFDRPEHVARELQRKPPFAILMAESLLTRGKGELLRTIRSCSHAPILAYGPMHAPQKHAALNVQAEVGDCWVVSNDTHGLVTHTAHIIDKTLHALVDYQTSKGANGTLKREEKQRPSAAGGSKDPFDLYEVVGKRWLCCHDVFLDVMHGYVSFQGKSIQLTKNERAILGLLMHHVGTVMSRSEIQTYLWHSDSYIDDNTLTVNINRLRSALMKIGVRRDFVHTKRGKGYMILPECTEIS